MPTYFIRDWNKYFETAQSRKYEKLSWVAIPNKHDGKGFARLMRLENGIALFGVWVLIVQVASKCPTRGVLADPDGPLTAEDIADKTKVPSGLIENALQVLSSDNIKWLGIDDTGSALVASDHPAGSTLPIHNSTEPDITEHKNRPVSAGRGNGNWKRPSKEAMQQPSSLMAWADLEAEKAGLPALTPDARIWLLAAALRALEHGKNPPRLFASLLISLVSGDVSLLEEYRKRAEARYREWKPAE